jgi:hypothetical protein
MNIIFGMKEVEKLKEKYIVLEADTFKFPTNQTETAYVVVEDMPIKNIPHVENMKEIHDALLRHYKDRDWPFCLTALGHLTGFFGDDMDTYYHTMRERITILAAKDPGPEWTHIISKK